MRVKKINYLIVLYKGSTHSQGKWYDGQCNLFSQSRSTCLKRDCRHRSGGDVSRLPHRRPSPRSGQRPKRDSYWARTLEGIERCPKNLFAMLAFALLAMCFVKIYTWMLYCCNSATAIVPTLGAIYTSYFILKRDNIAKSRPSSNTAVVVKKENIWVGHSSNQIVFVNQVCSYSQTIYYCLANFIVFSKLTWLF